jgi:hypothetical protein
MTDKKLSRRDTIKMLGVAVGTAALSGLPSKWNTPEVVAGALPAHARQSAVAMTCASPLHTYSAAVATANGNPTQLNPIADLGVPAGTVVNYQITLSAGNKIGGSSGPFSGTITAAVGGVNLGIGTNAFVAGGTGNVFYTWSGGSACIVYNFT